MPGLPYLPGGLDELPAEKFLLFADENNRIFRIDESNVQKNTTSFTAHWESGTLNQIAEGRLFTLRVLELYYAALATTSVTVKVSGDGGENYDAGQVVSLPITAGRIGRVAVTFDGLEEATGDDLRFRLELDTDILANIYGYREHIADRGDLLF